MTQPTDNSKNYRWPVVVAVFVLIPFLYIASVGPAMYLCMNTDTFHPMAVIQVYRPLMELSWKHPLFGKVYNRYVGLWTGQEDKTVMISTGVQLQWYFGSLDD